MSAGNWYFFVGWKDASASTINLQLNNGTVLSAATTQGDVGDGNPFGLSMAVTGFSSQINGRVDSVGFWKRVLTATERADLYNGAKGKTFDQINTAERYKLISWWDLDEAAGTTRYDRWVITT